MAFFYSEEDEILDAKRDLTSSIRRLYSPSCIGYNRYVSASCASNHSTANTATSASCSTAILTPPSASSDNHKFVTQKAAEPIQPVSPPPIVSRVSALTQLLAAAKLEEQLKQEQIPMFYPPTLDSSHILPSRNSRNAKHDARLTGILQHGDAEHTQRVKFMDFDDDGPSESVVVVEDDSINEAERRRRTRMRLIEKEWQTTEEELRLEREKRGHGQLVRTTTHTNCLRTGQPYVRATGKARTNHVRAW
jgi:hypothetical protein